MYKELIGNIKINTFCEYNLLNLEGMGDKALVLLSSPHK